MAIINSYQVQLSQQFQRAIHLSFIISATPELTANSSLSAESFQVVTQSSGLCYTYSHVTCMQH